MVNETEDNLESKKTIELKDIEINLEEYERIILGTPVWWYTITPPIRTFLTKYDLSGKIVIPFATNAGWPGQTFDEIKELCKGKVMNEISIKFGSNRLEDKLITTNEEIEEWINSLK